MAIAGGHVAVCTFPFSCHPLAFFNLVCRLAKEAPQVQFSFFSTARTNSVIRSTQCSIDDFPTNVKAYDVDDGIPGDITDLTALDHAEEVSCFLKQVPNNFKTKIASVVAETGARKVTCLITDALFSFSIGEMAEEMNVFWTAFMVPAPHDLVSFFEMDQIRQLYANAQDENDQIDIIPGLSPIRFKDLPHEIFLTNPSNVVVPLLSSMVKKLPQASALVLNSYEELNHNLLINYLKSKVQNLLFVGSLTEFTPSDNIDDPTGCLSWLDGQKVGSVIYISFGTVAELEPEELKALAEALEVSGIPFLWSLKEKLKNYLPNGFLERNGKYGKVVSWAPQRKVLQHSSTGVFVTQGGYNSILESISFGVPMICRPYWTDNFVNAKLVEEIWGNGLRIEGRVITKSGMLKCLAMIFEDEKGKKMRKASCDLKQVWVKAAGPDGVAAKHFKILLQLITG